MLKPTRCAKELGSAKANQNFFIRGYFFSGLSSTINGMVNFGEGRQVDLLQTRHQRTLLSLDFIFFERYRGRDSKE